ncbi:MAG: leucine-rich repeat domain-containing protein [Lachnospiraceae bacterium]|nr:leucine-rich repeat domain-containing protein [Lachnospiraceae bacterium]
MANKWLKKLGLGIAAIMTISQVSGIVCLAAFDDVEAENVMEVDEINETNRISIDNERIIAILYDDGTLEISGSGVLDVLKEADNSSFGADAKKLIINTGITEIGDRAFEGYGFETVILPSSVEAIGKYAFGHCLELQNVTIPEGVRSIGMAAFEACLKLEAIRIPASVTSIEAPLFDFCYSLTSLEVDSNNKVYDSRNNCNAIMNTSTNTLITGCNTTVIPEDTVAIGENALAYLKLESVTIPNKVTKLDTSAFNTNNSLKELYIPASVKTIENKCFDNCDTLTDVYYGGSETDWENIYIGSKNNVLLLAAIHYEKTNGSETVDIENGITIDNGRITAVLDDAGTLKIQGTGALWQLKLDDNSFFGQEATNLIIEEGITEIGAHTFEYYPNLESVMIPSSVKSIGRQAFGHCSELKKVTISEGVETIGMAAFETCQKLENIKLPASVTSIEAPLFDFCYSLTSLEVDSNNKVYDSRNNCNAVMKTDTNTLVTGCVGTTIPEDTLIIGKYAMSYLNIETIAIPAGITQIQDNAFNTCNNLKEVYLPSSLISIGNKAFAECASLKTIYIPKNVKTLDGSCFYHAYNLADIYYGGNEEEWKKLTNNSSINDISQNTTIHYNYVSDKEIEAADEAAAKSVSEKIDAIGDIVNNNECKQKIDDARTSYEKLTEVQKELVYNVNKLVEAEMEYERLIAVPQEGNAIVKNENGSMEYYRDGEKQNNYLGLICAENEWYYIVDGIVDDKKNGFIDYEGGKFLIVNGKLETNSNGLVMDSENSKDWYFCSNGQVQLQHTGLAQYDGEWFYVNNGKLDVTLADYVEYDGGLFFVGAGRIMTEVNGLAKDPDGPDWYYLSNGQAQIQYTGLALYDGEWFYVIAGKLAEDYTGPVDYDGETFNVVSGMVK